MIYCDGSLIYQYPVKNNNLFADSSGYNWNFVPIPQTTMPISIHLSSPYEGVAESIPIFYVGSTFAVFSEIVSQYIIPFLMCFILFGTGICMIIYWLYVRSRTYIKPALLYLGILALIVSVWSSTACHLTLIIFRNNLVCYYLAFISLMLIPMPFALFVKSHYEDSSKMWDIFCFVDMIHIILCLSLQLSSLADFRITMWSTHAMLIIVAVLILFTSFKLLRQRHNLANIKLHLLCILICTIASMTDMAFYYIGSDDCNALGRVGFVLYFVIIGFSYLKESAKLIKLANKANDYQQLAYTDQMTRVSNRTAFHQDFEILSASPNDIGIILFDLNNLKKVNDTLGHAFGDEYIINSAKIISHTFSHLGKCYRVGGDEFVVIIEHASHFDFQYYFDMMDWSINSFNKNQKQFHMQIAYGYSIYDSKTDKKLYDTYQKADKNMYQTKKLQKKKIRS